MVAAAVVVVVVISVGMVFYSISSSSSSGANFSMYGVCAFSLVLRCRPVRIVSKKHDTQVKKGEIAHKGWVVPKVYLKAEKKLLQAT